MDPIEKEKEEERHYKNTYLNYAATFGVERHKGTGWISIICLSLSDGAEDNTSNLIVLYCTERVHYDASIVYVFPLHCPLARSQYSAISSKLSSSLCCR